MPFPVGTEVVVTYSCGGTRTKFAGCFWLFIPCGDSMQSVPSMLLFLGNPNKNITKPLNDFAFSLQVQPINYFAELSSHVALSSRGVQDRGAPRAAPGAEVGSAMGSLAQTPPGKLMLEGLSSQGGLFYFAISIFSFLKSID